MSYAELRNKVLSVTSHAFGIHPDLQPHHAQQQLIDDLGADSLEVALLALDLEEAFSIEIADDELFKKTGATVGDVIQLVTSKLSMEVTA